jgi:beta-N-acetylhexosaminidase
VESSGTTSRSESSPEPARTDPAAPTGEAAPDVPAAGEPDTTARAQGGPGQDPGWGPTRAELERAGRLAAGMSTKQLAGQVIVADHSGPDAPTGLVTGLDLGGVIVMGNGSGDVDRIRRSNQRLQQAVRADGRRWPAFIGVDQEGGIVERVKGSATRFPAFMTTGAADDTRLTTNAAAASGAELADLGFTVVFAPSGDVTSGPSDPTIGSRSAGSRPPLVARHMSAAVDGYRSAGVLPVIKHFPGHGSVPADSHYEMPVQKASLRTLDRRDLVPFATGVERGVSSVMVAHIDVRAVDPGVPASLSRKVVTGMLRERLGFDGLVVTDALNMLAVSGRFSSGEAAVRALRAGNDVLLMPQDPRAARDGIVRAVSDGRLSRSRLEQAAARQIAMLLHQDRLDATVTGAAGSSGEVSRRLSARGVTVVAGRCRGPLVGRSVRGVGDPSAVAAFHRAARRAGLRTGAGATVALIGYRGAPRSADIVVSTDTPYVLSGSRARTAKVALYGDTPGAMRALVDVLRGKAQAPGRLPVPVAGVPRDGC